MRIRRVCPNTSLLPILLDTQTGGYTLRSAGEFSLPPRKITWLPCGFALELPTQHVGFVRGHPDLYLRGLTCPGWTLTRQHTQELKIPLRNEQEEAVYVAFNMPIASLFLMPWQTEPVYLVHCFD